MKEGKGSEVRRRTVPIGRSIFGLQDPRTESTMPEGDSSPFLHPPAGDSSLCTPTETTTEGERIQEGMIFSLPSFVNKCKENAGEVVQ